MAIALVGEPDLIHPEIERLGASNLPLQVVRSSGVVAEDESPVTAFRSKPNASFSWLPGRSRRARQRRS